MNERLIIENFAGIRGLDVQLNDINLFIGPQATGKSVVAKLLYLLKKFPETAFFSAFDGRDPQEDYLAELTGLFPPIARSSESFSVLYQTVNSWIRVSRTKNRLKLAYSENLSQAIQVLKGQISKTKDLDRGSIPGVDRGMIRLSDFLERMSSEVDPSLGREQQFIPAGRAFFSQVQASIFTLLAQNHHIDRTMLAFGSFYELLKNIEQNGVPSATKEKEVRFERAIFDLKQLQEEIIKGTFSIDARSGEEVIEMKGGRRVDLSFASSGQQEALPLTMALSSLPRLRASTPGLTLYIEEPGAHLFPSGQRYIVEMIARVFNLSDLQLQFVMTTHSPYTLTTFNNLLQAGSLYAQDLAEEELIELQQVIPQERTFRPDQVSVFFMENGGCRVIKGPEDELIDASALDEVSEDLSTQFDRLLEIA